MLLGGAALVDGAAPAPSTLLIEQLRTATQRSHRELEDVLALLSPPLARRRFVHAIHGFHDFHRLWEPRVEALIGDPALLTPRRKGKLLEQDLCVLEAMGGGGDFASVRPMSFDLGFLDGSSAAWGSLYVLEGSTLGGQMISKVLRGAGWLPPNGLRYFDPYGRATAAMWAEFRDALEVRAAQLDARATVDGACATFEALRAGFQMSAGGGA